MPFHLFPGEKGFAQANPAAQHPPARSLSPVPWGAACCSAGGVPDSDVIAAPFAEAEFPVSGVIKVCSAGGVGDAASVS